MIHVDALPGTPKHRLPIYSIVEKAVEEASVYLACGLGGILIENMHDTPYLNRSAGPEIVACMTAVASSIRKMTNLPLGIQILAGANQQALAVALASGLDFIRAEGFVFGHLADEGYMDSCAGELMRYRKIIGAESIAIFTDVKKKHASHQISADINLADTIRAAEFFASDGIIVTGNATGHEPDLGEAEQAYQATTLPVLIGSGISVSNIDKFWHYADAFVVGSYFKVDGNWQNPVDKNRVMQLMEQVQINNK